MSVRFLSATSLFAVLVAHYACSVDAVELEGKECPCAAGYTCDPRTRVCIIGNATGGAAGATGGAAGATGSGGSAGGGKPDASSGGAGGTTDAGGSDVSSDGKPSGGGGASGGTGGSASGGSGGTSAGGGGGTSAGGSGSTGGSKNSCVGHCDLIDTPVPGSSPKCYCDDACEGFGDCCSDKIKACGAAPVDAGMG